MQVRGGIFKNKAQEQRHQVNLISSVSPSRLKVQCLRNCFLIHPSMMDKSRTKGTDGRGSTFSEIHFVNDLVRMKGMRRQNDTHKATPFGLL